MNIKISSIISFYSTQGKGLKETHAWKWMIGLVKWTDKKTHKQFIRIEGCYLEMNDWNEWFWNHFIVPKGKDIDWFEIAL